MPAGKLLLVPQWLGNSGDPLDSGLLNAYYPGGTTRKDIYADEDLATPLANPVTLTSSGRKDVFLAPGPYKLVITTSAGVTVWQADNYEPGGGGLVSILSKSTNYTVTTEDGTNVLVLVDASGGATTITLPPAADASGYRVTVKKIDSSANAVTVDGNASETIDDATTITLSTQYDGAQLVSTATEWFLEQPVVAQAWAALEWDALGNRAPASNYATLDYRNQHPVLDFDGASDEEAIFVGRMPDQYNGEAMSVLLFVGFTSATSGTSRWQADFERINASGLDIDADSFSGVFQSAGLSAPGTAGQFAWVTISFTSSQIDGLVAGEMFRLKIRRDADGTSGTDDIATDAELMRVVMKQA